jgi:hypothetical protein
VRVVAKSVVILLCILSISSFAKPNTPKLSPASSIKKNLLKSFSKTSKGKDHISKLQKEVLSLKGKAVPALIEVMKNGKYPEKNRWVATFLLGRIMGVKSAPFVSKFLKHPSWVMRMASLKTLLALKQTTYSSLYRKALKDKSFIVRVQALENIRHLNLRKEAPYVWSMLYDKKNYYTGKKKKDIKKLKRTNIIKSVIKTVGDLKFEKAKKPMLAMIQKEKYKDIFSELDYSLSKITGKKSPKRDERLKKRFWTKIALSEKTI